MTDAQKSYRYERKFFVEGLDPQHVIGLLKLHPAMLTQIYPPRYVNNIYLDSPWMDDYFDNLGGVSERRKTRLRWYHGLCRPVPDGTLEFKLKHGLVGAKVQHPFPRFEFSREFSIPYLREVVRTSELPLQVKAVLKRIEPVLVNRYRRWYFATPDRKFRVTVDTGLSFYHLNKFSSPLLYKQQNGETVVVELKYQAEDDPQASKLTSGFPFRLTRSSKYVQGIEHVYL